MPVRERAESSMVSDDSSSNMQLEEDHTRYMKEALAMVWQAPSMLSEHPDI